MSECNVCDSFVVLFTLQNIGDLLLYGAHVFKFEKEDTCPIFPESWNGVSNFP